MQNFNYLDCKRKKYAILESHYEFCYRQSLYLFAVPCRWKRICKQNIVQYKVICHLHTAVAGDRRDTCNVPKQVHLRDDKGYISNMIAAESSLGTLTCPWSIKAKSAQNIRLTVYDFGSVIKSETADKWTRINYSARNCPTFLFITEVPSGEEKRLALCGDGVRYRHLYTSNRHQLRLHFTSLTSFPNLPYFLVKYEGKWKCNM